MLECDHHPEGKHPDPSACSGAFRAHPAHAGTIRSKSPSGSCHLVLKHLIQQSSGITACFSFLANSCFMPPAERSSAIASFTCFVSCSKSGIIIHTAVWLTGEQWRAALFPVVSLCLLHTGWVRSEGRQGFKQVSCFLRLLLGSREHLCSLWLWLTCC